MYNKQFQQIGDETEINYVNGHVKNVYLENIINDCEILMQRELLIINDQSCPGNMKIFNKWLEVVINTIYGDGYSQICRA